MDSLSALLVISQFIFMAVAGAYFYQSMQSQSASKNAVKVDSKKEYERLKKMRSVHLTEPLSEKARPQSLEEVVGQEEGIKALRAALCSKNPQHVLIYGPPGVGKTAAARLILEEAKKNGISPFLENARFIEMDATTLRFDERSIADPLMGSVHDPIYQGAGAFGPAGIPQPKEGAVTKANGGILFLDEIGELHPVQMNKLLKVLEDRIVYLSSSYYNSENKSIPEYIHDIFKNGLPADFRLIGATTRNPEDIPPALRSRCSEIFFEELKPVHIRQIAENSVEKTGSACTEEVIEKIAAYAQNGRDTVNMVQTAASVAFMEGRKEIKLEDIEWVAETGRYTPSMHKKLKSENEIGVVNGLAVCGAGGAILEIEATARKAERAGEGSLMVTGIVEEEEIKNASNTMKRPSTARASVENVMTAIEKITGTSAKDYHIHINFPGGMPVDGPSAGIAIFSAVYSAIHKKYVRPKTAMTGELSIMGNVLPVGGVTHKIEAAVEAGAEIIMIPKANWQESYRRFAAKIYPVSDIHQVLSVVFEENPEALVAEQQKRIELTKQSGVLTAEGI